jgi:hypothetical protein
MKRARDLILAYARSDALPLTLLALLVIIVFYDVVFLGKTTVTSSFLWGTIGSRPPYGYPGPAPDYNVYILDPLATAVSSEPIVEKTAAMFRDLELPLWNSDTAMGRPLLGGFSAELTNPFRWPLAIFPSPWMWDATMLARFWVAGVFTYFLVKSLGVGRTGSLAAAAAYILSGYFMLYLQTPHVDYAMFLPVLLYSFELLSRERTPLRVAFAAATIALLVLSDNPEAAAIGLLFGGFYYLFRIAPQHRPLPAVRTNWRGWASSLGPFVLAAVAGIGLTATVLLPFLELTGSLPPFDGYTIHRHAAGSGIGTLHDSLDRAVSFFVPYFNGVPVSNFQHDGLSGARNWFGIVPAFFAVIAISRGGSWTHPRWFFAAAAALFIMKTYGVPIVNDFGRLPLLEVIDWSLYSGPCIALSVAVLVGLGVHALRVGAVSRTQLAVSIAFLTVLGLWFLYLNRDLLDTIPKSHLLVWVGAPVALGTIVVAAYLLARQRLLGLRLVGAAAALVVAVELAFPTAPMHTDFGGLVEDTFVRHLTVVDRPERYDPATKPPYVDFLQEDDSVYRVFGLDRILYPNYQEAYGLDAITGFTATSIERYYRYVRAVIQPDFRSRFTGSFLPPLNSERAPPMIVANTMFDLTNVKYVMTRSERTIVDSLGQPELADEVSAQFRLVYEDDVRIWENLNAIPRAFLVTNVDAVDDPEAALDAVSDATFDPRFKAVVENAPDDDLALLLPDADPAADVTFLEYDDNEVRLRVTTDEPGLLVLTDTYAPGWHAEIDGDDTTIYATDYAFRGVFVPAGEHTIEFTYSPASFKAGVAIALLSVLALAGYASYYYRWPRIGGRRR